MCLCLHALTGFAGNSIGAPMLLEPIHPRSQRQYLYKASSGENHDTPKILFATDYRGAL